MARLAAGNDAALNDIMGRHAKRMFHYLLRALGNEEDAADLAQETFVRVYRNRASFDPKQKFTTWLYAIAGNLVRDRFRWRSRHPLISMDAGSDASQGWDNLPDRNAGPDQALQVQERAAQVKNAIAGLPAELREPLILAVYEGLSQAEIGAVLKCSAKAVENRLYRARLRLRERLSRLL